MAVGTLVTSGQLDVSLGDAIVEDVPPSRHAHVSKSRNQRARKQKAAKAALEASVAKITNPDVDSKPVAVEQPAEPVAKEQPAVVNEVECDDQEVVSAGDLDLAGLDFVNGLGLVLTRWVEATSAMTETGGSTRRVTQFHSIRPPAMTIKDYLQRIHKYFQCTDECYVIALVYIDRVGKIDPAMTVCELNVHRLLVLCVMLAAKFHDDVYYSNSYYSKVGGLSLKEVNALEAKFLKMLDWRVNVDLEEYKLYRSLVCQATSLGAAAATAHPRKEPEPEPSRSESR